MALNLKQEKFCLEYAKTANATESYKKAGYKAKDDYTANVSACRLLKNDKVKARLQELTEEMKSEKIATVAEIQERLTAILRMEQTEEQVIVEGCGDGVSEGRIIQRKPAMKDVIKAGETLAKMQGAFNNDVNVNVTIPVFGGEDRLED